MFFAFANAQVTRVQDLLWALIQCVHDFYHPLFLTMSTSPNEPQVEAPPLASTEAKPPQGGAFLKQTPDVETIIKSVTISNFCVSLTSNISKHSSLFALLIGIDEYKHDSLNNLNASVADAKAVKRYLETSLGVPESQIKTLYNHEATRDAIIDNISALKTNPSIYNGDPILIYYSGHGGTANAPVNWEAGGPEIQILLSHDALCEDSGREIYGVPDRTMGALLDQLSNEKGNNIVGSFLPYPM